MVSVRTTSRSALQATAAHWKVLLVEDQRSLAQMTAKMLHDRWDCHVLIATSLAEVRAIIADEKKKFSLAVSDLNLPDAPNGEVIKELVDAGIPVVAMTGTFDDRLYDVFMQKGLVDYVLKGSLDAYIYITELVGRLNRNRSTKVLIVDDSEPHLQLIEAMLHRQLLQVFHARNAEEGLKVLEKHPDTRLMLIDAIMPGMQGVEFVSVVRQRFGKERLAIIGITGVNDPRMSARFIRHGANDFIFKPFSYEELSCRVNQNLDMLERLDAMHVLAYTDYLTSLPNRRMLFEKGRTLHELSRQAKESQTLAILDIDHFKHVNDQFGHEFGDLVLQHLSGALAQGFRNDFVARIGGEEFVLLIKGNHSAALKRLEALRQAVEGHPVVAGDVSIPYTVSIGAVAIEEESLENALRTADSRLYLAKEAGRNRVVSK